MPNNFLAIDTNFPTFTGEEPVEEQVRGLTNYLYQLRESLQYSLQNLSTDNFNAAALDSLSEEAKGEIGKQLQKIDGELNLLQQEVNALKGRVSGVDELKGRMDSVEGNITDLKARMDAAESDVEALGAWSTEQEKLTGEHGQRLQNAEEELADLKSEAENTGQRVSALGELVESMDTDVAELQSAVQVAGDGSATVGAQGKELHLVGTIYINGVLFEGGSA